MKCKKLWAKQLLSVAITSVLFSTAQAAAGVNGNAAIDLVPAMGVGWNLGNSLDAYHPRKEWAEETVWHNPRITPELIQAVHEAGFNTIRIPITYIGRVENGPAYTIDADYLARIKEVVDYAYNEGMYVIINIHHDGGGDWEHGAWLNCEAADQTAVKKKFQAMWYQIADKFKDYDQHLLFEGMNEIHEHQNWNAPKKAQSMKNLNAYNQLFLDTVRKTGGKNNDRVLVVAGYNTNINFTTDAKYGFVLPKDSVDNRLMISVHYYDPYAFALDESENAVYAWGSEAEKKGLKTTPGEDEAAASAEINRLYDRFTSHGIPVIIGEYGTIDKSEGHPEYKKYRAVWYEYITKEAIKAGAVPIVWDNGYQDKTKSAFALFDRKTGEETEPDLVKAIMKGKQEGEK